MDDGQLNRMVSRLTSDIKRLEADLEEETSEQDGMLASLRKRLDAASAQHAEVAEAATRRTEGDERRKATDKDAIAADEAEAASIAESAAQERRDANALRQQLSGRLAQASQCSCEGLGDLAQLGLLRRSALLRPGTGSRGAEAAGLRHEGLVREVEKLESRRDGLQKALEAGLAQFGREQRELLADEEALAVRRRVQSASEAQAAHASEGAAGRLGRQVRAAAAFRKVQAGRLARARADAGAARERLEEVEAALARCGC